MIPVSLTIQGLYSYQSAQTIDFTRLTSGHLFGIFGPVGSGKSSLLEAITLALYNETERLNSRDGRAYNMMNLRSKTLGIEFIFKAGKGDRDTYKITVQGKRDTKTFGNVKAYSRMAYRLQGSHWLPLDECDGESILGLSYDNFRRTIIIPQGKFQEFLQLSNTDRTRMLKDIFNLDKYELAEQTGIVEKETAGGIKKLEGQLSEIGDISAELIQDRKKAQEEAEADQATKDKALKESQKTDRGLDELKKLHDQFIRESTSLSEMEKKTPAIDKEEKTLERYEQCVREFSDLLGRQVERKGQLQGKKDEMDRTRESHRRIVKEVESIESDLTLATKQSEKRDDVRAEIEDLRNLQKIRDMDTQIEKQRGQVAKIAADLKAVRESLSAHEAEQTSTGAELKRLKTEQPDIENLHELETWFKRAEEIAANLKEGDERLAEATKALAVVEKGFSKIVAGTVVTRALAGQPAPADPQQVLALLASCRPTIKARIREIRDQVTEARLRAGLVDVAKKLKPGKPCPVCGSTEHPNPCEDARAGAAVESLAAAVEKAEKELDEVEEVIWDASRAIDGMDAARKEEKNAESAVEKLREKDKIHQASFPAKGYSTKDGERVLRELTAARESLKKIKKLEELRELADSKLKNERDSEKSLLSDQSDAEKTLAGDQRVRKQLEEGLRILSVKSESKKSSLDLKKEAERLVGELDSLAARMKTLKDRHTEAAKSRDQLSGKIEALQKDLVELETQLQKLGQEIDSRLAASSFEGIGKVRGILAEKLNAEAIRKRIAAFREHLQAQRDAVKRIKAEVGTREYDAKEHMKLKGMIDKLSREEKAANMLVGQLRDEVDRLQKKLQRQEKLNEQLAKLKLRMSNIDIMKRLFRASGFVNFVSRAYLRDLCQIGNRRFSELTRQKLHLEMGPENEFLVRDFMNDGRTRSAKTLSGGQIFQAALSLALALTDSIQSFNEAEQNFFFLDEGFGTLDKESLAIVFETLKSLRKENRIIGVISHVEELQQEIENSVRVVNDEIEGSRVQVC